MRLVKNVTALHTSKKRKILRRYLHYKGITRACSTLGIRTRLRAAYPYSLAVLLASLTVRSALINIIATISIEIDCVGMLPVY